MRGRKHISCRWEKKSTGVDRNKNLNRTQMIRLKQEQAATFLKQLEGKTPPLSRDNTSVFQSYSDYPIIPPFSSV